MSWTIQTTDSSIFSEQTVESASWTSQTVGSATWEEKYSSGNTLYGDGIYGNDIYAVTKYSDLSSITINWVEQ